MLCISNAASTLGSIILTIQHLTAEYRTGALRSVVGRRVDHFGDLVGFHVFAGSGRIIAASFIDLDPTPSPSHCLPISWS